MHGSQSRNISRDSCEKDSLILRPKTAYNLSMVTIEYFQ